MANVKSAKKRVKVLAKKTLINKMRKTNLKTVLKKATLAQGDSKKAAVLLAIKKVDQAASHGILHKNTANRKKSQLMKLLNA